MDSVQLSLKKNVLGLFKFIHAITKEQNETRKKSNYLFRTNQTKKRMKMDHENSFINIRDRRRSVFSIALKWNSV